MIVCVRESEHTREQEGQRQTERERERERACVCVFEREREREKERETLWEGEMGIIGGYEEGAVVSLFHSHLSLYGGGDAGCTSESWSV